MAYFVIACLAFHTLYWGAAAALASYRGAAVAFNSSVVKLQQALLAMHGDVCSTMCTALSIRYAGGILMASGVVVERL